MKKSILILILLGFINYIFPQTFNDVAFVNYGGSNMQNKGGYDVDYRYIDAKIGGGKEIDGALYFAGLEHVKKTINWESSTDKQSLYSYFLNIGFYKDFGKWTFMGIPKIKVNSLDNSFESKYFQPGFIGISKYKLLKDFDLVGGVYYNQEESGALIFPMLGIDWLIKDRLNIYLLVPFQGRIEYRFLTNKLYSGLELDWYFNTYKIANEHDNYIVQEDRKANFFVEFAPINNVWIYAKAGFADNPFSFHYAPDGMAENHTEFKSCYSFQIGLSYRLRTKN